MAIQISRNLLALAHDEGNCVSIAIHDMDVLPKMDQVCRM